MSDVMDLNANIYVEGHRGLVGTDLVKNFQPGGYTDLLTHIHAELNLTDQQSAKAFFKQEHSDHVFLAAAKLGASTPTMNTPQNLSATIWSTRLTSSMRNTNTR